VELKEFQQRFLYVVGGLWREWGVRCQFHFKHKTIATSICVTGNRVDLALDNWSSTAYTLKWYRKRRSTENFLLSYTSLILFQTT